jgi:hypothetical protein
MANRRMATIDIVELVRLLRSEESDRRTTHLLGPNRRTIARYREWAVAHGLREGPLPPEGELHGLLARTMPDTPPWTRTTAGAASGTGSTVPLASAPHARAICALRCARPATDTMS